MKATVEHDSISVVIRWWPFDDYISWAVHKQLDTSSVTLPLPVLPAHIDIGSSPTSPATPQAAERHAKILLQAASLAKQLDDVIQTRDGFVDIKVREVPTDFPYVPYSQGNGPVSILIPRQADH